MQTCHRRSLAAWAACIPFSAVRSTMLASSSLTPGAGRNAILAVRISLISLFPLCLRNELFCIADPFCTLPIYADQRVTFAA